jgi:hypothetical protein
MPGVFRNIDPPPSHHPASVYPSAFGAEGGHTRWVERGWGSIVGKMPDTALYSPYVSTLCGHLMSSFVGFLSGIFYPNRDDF